MKVIKYGGSHEDSRTTGGFCGPDRITILFEPLWLFKTYLDQEYSHGGKFCQICILLAQTMLAL